MEKQTIEAVVVRPRGMNLAGVGSFAKDAVVPLDEGQFEQLGPNGLGWVERATAPAAEPVAKPPVDDEGVSNTEKPPVDDEGVSNTEKPGKTVKGADTAAS